jgi:hypothetical protein
LARRMVKSTNETTTRSICPTMGIPHSWMV